MMVYALLAEEKSNDTLTVSVLKKRTIYHCVEYDGLETGGGGGQCVGPRPALTRGLHLELEST